MSDYDPEKDPMRIASGEVRQTEVAVSAPRVPPEELRVFVEKWRAEGRRLDTFHATMGSGWKACADELAAILAADPLPAAPRVQEQEKTNYLLKCRSCRKYTSVEEAALRLFNNGRCGYCGAGFEVISEFGRPEVVAAPRVAPPPQPLYRKFCKACGVEALNPADECCRECSSTRWTSTTLEPPAPSAAPQEKK